MARLRTIKPGFFENEELAECSAHARLLFIGLWCHADRRGILENRPKWLKFNVFPSDDVSVTSLLDELETHQFIQRYERDGVKCIIIPKFQKHQSPHQFEKENGLPLPESTVPVPDLYRTSMVPVSDQSVTSPLPARLLLGSGVMGSGKKKNPSDSKKTTEPIERGSRIDPEWQPTPDLVQYAVDQGITDVPATVVEFVDYYVTHNKIMLQWPRVWQRWCRNQKNFRKPTNGHYPTAPIRTVPEYTNNEPY